jgi:hypothetical protein
MRRRLFLQQVLGLAAARRVLAAVGDVHDDHVWRAAWTDVHAEASRLFHDGMRAAGLEVKPGDRLRERDAVMLAITLAEAGGEGGLSLARAIAALVDECHAKRLERFYPLPSVPGQEYGQAIGPLRCTLAPVGLGGAMVAVFDVLGTAAV